jgi:membrane protease YdiL (CAAX protease family)
VTAPTGGGPRWRPRRGVPRWPAGTVPRNQRQSDVAFAHRRRVVAGVTIGGAGLLGLSLSSEPGSRRFYVLTLGVATTWLVGGVRSGPLQPAWVRSSEHRYRRQVIAPVAAGGAAFGAFYAAALIGRRLPVLNEAVTSVLRFASRGSDPLVLLTSLANGFAEEVFFRGALFDAVGERHAVPASTAIYMLVTAATRNPALVLASGAMGALFGLQRRVSGGIQAPILTHLTWSTLMLRFLPPLFRDEAGAPSTKAARS